MTRFDPPPGYDPERRTIWDDTVTQLTEGGRIFRADPRVLDTYVQAAADHADAVRLRTESGGRVAATHDGKVIEHPLLIIQRRAAAALAAASKTLGLDRAPLEPAPSMTPPAAGPVHDGKCGGKTRAGGTCGQAAGWGTGHAGTGRCKLHGGTSPAIRSERNGNGPGSRTRSRCRRGRGCCRSCTGRRGWSRGWTGNAPSCPRSSCGGE